MDSRGDLLASEKPLSVNLLFHRFQQQGDNSCSDTGAARNDEGSKPGVYAGGASVILEISRDLGAGNSGHAVSQEHPSIVMPDILVAEEIRCGYREEGEVSAEIEANDAGSDNQADRGCSHLEEEEHDDALQQAHQHQGILGAKLMVALAAAPLLCSASMPKS